MKTIRRAISLYMGMMLLPSLLLAAATIPGVYGKIVPTLKTVLPNQLPIQYQSPSGQPGLTYGTSSISTVGNQMTIFQNQSQAIIDWQSFNIGTNASVYFNQQGNTSWAALNRIWGGDPSQIYGHLTADGKIYLINQNGILFGPSSQVNVYGLVASSLNLSIDNFLASTLHFTTNSGSTGTLTANDLAGTFYTVGAADPFYSTPPPTPGVVSNTGTITTGNMGSVFLIGPNVENSGTVSSPIGQIGLAAGTDLVLGLPTALGGNTIESYPGGETRTTLVVKMYGSPAGSTATNLVGGLLEADTGLVGMYGNIVNQNGTIRSVTAVQRGGHVELFASGTISTGPGSLISIPVSDSSDEVNLSFATQRGDVTFSGLDPSNPSNPQVYPNLIVHQGSIVAPSGVITMNASGRVYLATGSVIDVSGLWVDEPASADLLSVQLNSTNLRDYYIQKGGVLQGQYIDFTSLSGSAIGDVSGAFATEGLTAMERHTVGGQVNITATTGDIVAMQGSLVNFSGGGVRYASGAVDTTKLVSGYEVFDISNASADVVYDSILNAQTFTNSRFGTAKTYDGIYYGGASPVKQYSQGYTVGSDAGTLSLQAPTVVLDGTVLGRVTNGLQQVLTSDPTNSLGNQLAAGYTEATGGQLIIGNEEAPANNAVQYADSANFVTTQIVVSAQTGSLLPTTFQPTDLQGNITPLPSSKTVLSAATLSNAGLSTLSLAANTTITVQPGAQITLNPGGTFNAWARRIEDYGGITVLGGSINLAIQTNITTDQTIGGKTNPNYVSLDADMIYIGSGASLVTRGERIDNSAVDSLTSGIAPTGHINGGSVSILDQTVTDQGVAVMPGALIDVSGGWLINPSGKVTGGDAGSLTMQGYSLVLGGTLQAQSLVGNKGGIITLTAGNATIAAAASPAPSFVAGPVPDSVKGQLILGAGLLDASGFTNITLNSVSDITVENGASLGPSLAKLATPVPGTGTGGMVPGATPVTSGGSGVILVSADYIGASSISLNAGKVGSNITSGQDNPYGPLNPVLTDSARAIVLSGASVWTAPAGSITVTAPGAVEVGGSLSAPAGAITLKTTIGDVTLDPGASVLAKGYDRVGTTSTVKGLAPDAVMLSGGTISINAFDNLILSPSSLVSVSGSSPVPQKIIGEDNSVSYVMNASQPGAVFLSAGGTVSLSPQADIEGRAAIAGLPGGTLSLATTGNNPLSLSVSDLARFQSGGFDALTLSSAGILNLSNPSGLGQVSFGRSLTLSAQTITGSGSDQINLSAPWIQVANNNGTLATPAQSGASAGITLSGLFLDVTGNVVFSGFNSVTLAADRDMRFSDAPYGTVWSGLLETSGDLTLRAARIYTTTLANFAPYTDSSGMVHSGGVVAGGTVTILPSGTTVAGPIYSAGGNLAIISEGAGIDQEGYLAAPMGSISLQATAGRVYLAPGSVTTTKGEASVLFGTIQEAQDSTTLGDNVWAIPDKSNPGAAVPYTAVTNVPVGSISLSGNEVIVREGAVVDVSGGGSIFASRFVPSYSGSNDPLAGSYVVVPGVVLPGNGVYLSGVKGLPAGTYSLLPAVVVDANGNVNPSQWAYLPNAMIITDLKTTLSTSKMTLTPDGYPIVGGYATFVGTSITTPTMEAYEVRPASLVLSQGQFSTQSLTAGAAGAVTVTGNTTILNGTISANPLAGYKGGSIALSGTNIVVQQTVASLGSGFDFTTPVAGNSDPVIAGLADTLTIAAPSLSGQGFQTIGLGVSNLTGSASSVVASSMEIKPGVTLQAENIILGAKNTITLDAGAQVLALALPGDTGEVSFVSAVDGNGSPTATLYVGANAFVHASNSVNLQVENSVLDPTATLKADHSSLNLQGSVITIYDPSVSQSSGSGLFLTINQWDNLSAIFENITLTSLSDLVFEGSLTLAPVADTLTLDTGRIFDSVANSKVSLSAQTIALQNTTGAIGVSSLKPTSQITVNASQIQMNQGNILFDGFSGVSLNGQDNVTFRGVGSLTTGGGNLAISTPRVATSYYLDGAGVYTAANYAINAGIGTVSMAGNGNISASTAAPGGTLAVTAGTIDISTIVEVPSGQLMLTATGTPGSGTPAAGNIILEGGGQLLAQGTPYAPGGVVSLTSTSGGAINLLSGSLIDVSAGSQGDAGSVSLYAPVGGVMLNGNVQGQATGGSGGSFSIVTNTIGDFSALNGKLSSTTGGGFTNSLNIEASAGDITIAAAQTISGQSVTITADVGAIDLLGTIDVSQPGHGGTAQVYAGQNLLVSGTINAYGKGANATGGNVTLGTSAGTLTLAGGTIDVSGTEGVGNNVDANGNPIVALGTVTFQALPSNMSLSGTVKGASSVVAEIEKVYVNQFQGVDGTGGISTVINTAATIQIQSDLTKLMNATSGLAAQLANGLSDGNGNVLAPYDATSNTGTFHLRPGVVIEQTKDNGSDGNLTIARAGWDLSELLYGGGNEPGTLTLRAAGNLNINGSLVSAPTYVNNWEDLTTLISGSLSPSWGFNLVAGARTSSPNPVAVVPGGVGGSLNVSANTVVYTETGALQFASAGDSVINQGPLGSNPYMITYGMNYSLATYSGSIMGNVGGNLTINAGGAIQSATGNIDISVGGNLNLNKGNLSSLNAYSLGSIRTTGETSDGDTTDFSAYNNGGSITLNVGGSVVSSALNPNAWLTAYYETIMPIYSYTISTEGIVTMAGGSVYVRSGDSFNAQIGTFGQGDLQVYSGGDLTGRFLINQGTGTLSAMGNFGIKNQPQLIEMSDAKVGVFAQGNIELGAALNPGLAAVQTSPFWDVGYTPESSLNLTAVTGDVNLYGTVDLTTYVGTNRNMNGYAGFYYTSGSRNTILPPSVAISAGRDINVMSQTAFVQMPSSTGELTMSAGRDIVFSVFSGSATASWIMSDAPLAGAYRINGGLSSGHALTPVHTDDDMPITISAAGDIVDAALTLPKMATVIAGGDITDINYNGQNIGPSDVTTIAAGGNIVFGFTKNVTQEGIQIGGPGCLIVEAAGKIDLGYSAGIQELGNTANQALAAGGSIIVAAGISSQLTLQSVAEFFSSLESAGTEYSTLKAAGDLSGAQLAITNARADIIGPLLGASNPSGDISMTSSQIATQSGGAIYALAAGELDVGTTALTSSTTSNKKSNNTGILTEKGGAIDVFAKGDVNVNTARIMSFMGGDIMAWSDQGNINAGKGDKATISLSPPTYSCTAGVCTVTFSPPAVGSGIRALTYAANENTPAPPPGDIYLFAPSGDIDAGEAGIAGGRVVLGATTVLNASNISSVGGTFGAPVSSQGVSLGALSGTSDMSKGNVSADTGALAQAQERVASTQPLEDMIVKWIDVKVIGYDLNFGTEDSGGDPDSKKGNK